MTDQFLNYLRSQRRASPQTVKTYETALSDFESHFTQTDNQLSWSTVDEDVIRNWMESMMDKGHSASTICKKLSALRSFYRFALKQGLVGRDPAYALRGPKREKPLPHFATEREMDRLLDVVLQGDSLDDVRARTVIMLLYECGLRRAELLGLDEGDVDLDACQLRVTGKGNKQRIVPFGAELAEQVARYLELRGPLPADAGQPLLTDDRGRRLPIAKLNSIVKLALGTATRLDKRSPHVLRHTFATAMLNNGASLQSVQRLLGHERVTTTEIYTHTTFEQLKKAYEKAHPRG